jgi:hypothetical protein
VYYGHCGVWDHMQAGSSRSFHSNEGIDTFNHIYIASNIISAFGQMQTEEGLLRWQLMAHHATSIGCFAGSWYFSRLRFWSAFAGLSETTNLFLVPVFAAKEKPDIKAHTWYKANSVLLWLSFLVYRGALFSAWLYAWYNDSTKPTNIHPMEEFVYPYTVCGLLLLSIAWFKQIHRGVVKVLTPGFYDSRGLHNNEKVKDF